MQDQPSDPDAGPSDDEGEREVLALLRESRLPGPWSVQRLGLEIGSALAAIDAVMRLHAAGLAHRCQEFVFPSRAASRFCQLLRD